MLISASYEQQSMEVYQELRNDPSAIALITFGLRIKLLYKRTRKIRLPAKFMMD
jgi:hypothetical protein